MWGPLHSSEQNRKSLEGTLKFIRIRNPEFGFRNYYLKTVEGVELERALGLRATATACPALTTLEPNLVIGLERNSQPVR